MDVQVELDSVEAELESVELQIAELVKKQAKLTTRRDALLQQVGEACNAAQPSSSSSSSSSSSKSARSNPGLSKQEIKRYDGTDFPWSKAVGQHLKDSFHLSKFRPLQLRAINLTMSGKDLFLVMPTGRGKSLCYQLPAVCSNENVCYNTEFRKSALYDVIKSLISPPEDSFYRETGFTLVVSPLVSLMEDQIMYLKATNVSAAMLNASTGKEHSKTVMAGMTDPNPPFKLLYVTPEKIAKSKLLMSRLEKAYNANLLSRIAVDEVHCCSQWGHDFRPDYKLLGILKRQFPKVPLLGLTATATSSVLSDCETILCVKQPVTLTASFNRTNLYYEVRVKESDMNASSDDIALLINSRYKDQSGIVYVFSQKEAETLSSELQKRKIKASPYHAYMDPKDKSEVHHNWTTDKIKVIVATVAFGMGIDKPDVRFVIHHTISKSIENYYQESGRAGRDDKPADCIVYFGFSDIFRVSAMVVMERVGQQKLKQMVQYCHNMDRCRRSLMAVHFDEVWDDKGCDQMCDTCRNGQDFITLDIAKHARQVIQILELAASTGEKLTPLKLVDAWMGKGPAKHRKMIQPTILSRPQVEDVIVHMLLQDYLGEDFSFTPYTTHCYLKLGPKAHLLKETHTLSMAMRTIGTQSSGDTFTSKVDEDMRVTFEHPQQKQKLAKDQKNLSRRQATDRRTERTEKHMADGHKAEVEDEKQSFCPKHTIEVDVELNIIESTDGQKNPSRPIKSGSKRKSTTPQRARRKPFAHSLVAGASPPSPSGDNAVKTVPSSPSQASIISDTAAEELSNLRNYYNKQLRRINYVSHEYLGQPADQGVLSCIREPLRSIRLPRRVTIAQTARSLWTRVSGRRRLVR